MLWNTFGASHWVMAQSGRMASHCTGIKSTRGASSRQFLWTRWVGHVLADPSLPLDLAQATLATSIYIFHVLLRTNFNRCKWKWLQRRKEATTGKIPTYSRNSPGPSLISSSPLKECQFLALLYGELLWPCPILLIPPTLSSLFSLLVDAQWPPSSRLDL